METNLEFILVDDDPVNNLLSEIFIESVFPKSNITSFTDPKLGLEHTLTVLATQEESNSILFLDLIMPQMSRWEFLDHFEKAVALEKNRIKIYILSSSVNPADKEKARQNPHIRDFVEKPLSEEVLKSLFLKS